MRIDSFAGSTAPTVNTGLEVINKLKPGDHVRAQVIENSGKELTLRFSDGSTVAATAASTVEAAEGEYVNLTYKGTVNEKPAFELGDKLPQVQGDKALEELKASVSALKLPLTQLNLQLARALIDKNMPVNAENMAKMLQLTEANSDLKPAAAAFMTSTKLAVDANNIEKLQNLLAGRLKIGNDLSELSRLFSPAGNSDSAADINMPALKAIVEKVTAQLLAKGVLTGAAEGDAVAAPKGNSDVKPEAFSQNKSANTEILINGKSTGQDNPAVNKAMSSEQEVLIKEASENKSGATRPKMAGDKAGIAAKSELAGEKAGIRLQSELAQSKAILAGQETLDSKTGVVRQGVAEVKADLLGQGSSDNMSAGKATTKLGQADQIKDTPFVLKTREGDLISQHNISERLLSILKGETLPGKSDFQLLNTFNRELVSLMNSTQLSNEELSAARQLAGRQNLPEAAAESLKSLFIKVGQSSDEIDPSSLYKDLYKALQTLKSELPQLPQGLREAAANIVGNLEGNLNFINQLNTYSSYVQLPLSIFDKTTTGELYMLKRGAKNKKLDPSNMTVLLSLDTERIGRIDTLLSIDKKNISTNFRVENSEVFPVLKEKHRELYNSFLEKGFRLVDFTYRLIEEPISIVNFEAEAKKEFLKGSNNIDISI